MSNIPPLPMTIPARPRRWVRVLVALLIFIGGMVCGGGLTIIGAVERIHHAIHHPEEVPGRITRYLTRRLDLSDDQSHQIEQIIREHQKNLQEIRRGVQPRVEAELELLRRDISRVLTPEQRDKWDDIFDDALDRWMPPPPPASPPTTQPS